MSIKCSAFDLQFFAPIIHFSYRLSFAITRFCYGHLSFQSKCLFRFFKTLIKALALSLSKQPPLHSSDEYYIWLDRKEKKRK